MSITREDVLTASDVAALLDLKPYTVKEYARRGILPGRKLGRTWRFLRPELEEAIRHLPRAVELAENSSGRRNGVRHSY
jgi:excisionase family DNA binding protein